VTVAAGYVLPPGEGVPDQKDPAVKASRVSTDGALTVIDSDTDGGAPRHVHAHEDECFYVLDGTITVECGDDGWELERGAFVFLPRGVPHAWGVVGDRARVLIITAPAGLEEFLRELHAPGGPGPAEVGRRHGIEFL
jgi:quercetin dioxygenase-like cupin family protein